jgi:hypothetical protein
VLALRPSQLLIAETSTGSILTVASAHTKVAGSSADTCSHTTGSRTSSKTGAGAISGACASTPVLNFVCCLSEQRIGLSRGVSAVLGLLMGGDIVCDAARSSGALVEGHGLLLLDLLKVLLLAFQELA